MSKICEQCWFWKRTAHPLSFTLGRCELFERDMEAAGHCEMWETHLASVTETSDAVHNPLAVDGGAEPV